MKQSYLNLACFLFEELEGIKIGKAGLTIEINQKKTKNSSDAGK